MIEYQRCRNPGVAQFGSALEWGSRGREFDSRHSDQSGNPVELFDWIFALFFFGGISVDLSLLRAGFSD